MRFALALSLAAFAVPLAAAPNPLTIPTKLDPAWQVKTRALFKQVIEIPTVKRRGKVPRMAALLADQFKAAGSRRATSTSCLTRRCPATRPRR